MKPLFIFLKVAFPAQTFYSAPSIPSASLSLLNPVLCFHVFQLQRHIICDFHFLFPQDQIIGVGETEEKVSSSLESWLSKNLILTLSSLDMLKFTSLREQLCNR